MKLCRYCNCELTLENCCDCRNGVINQLLCRKCKSKQSVANSKQRSHGRKQKLIDMFGGKCSRCNYDRCRSALTFHHLDPSTKLFCLGVRELCKKSWDKIINEANKCILLCQNCHCEEHWPDAQLFILSQQHFLNFRFEPQGHNEFLPIFLPSPSRTLGVTL